MSNHGWIGVDLDGTLAEYSEWKGASHIGAPIRAMTDRVQQWLHEGRDVRIFTARVWHDSTAPTMLQAQDAMIAIMDWCVKVFNRTLPVTCTKDYSMIELYDDRAIQVRRNTGELVQ